MSTFYRNLFRHRKSHTTPFIATTFFLFAATMAVAQDHPSLEELKAKYPKEHAVMLEDAKTLTVRLVKGKPKIEEIVTETYMILDETGVSEYAKERIDFTTSEIISDVKAYSINPQNKRINAYDFETTDVLAGGFVFYDGSKEMKITYGQLEVGSVRYLTYKRAVDEARFPSRHFFSASIPVIKSSFRISAPINVTVGYKLVNLPENQLTFETTSDAKMQSFLWETTTIYQHKREPNAPAPLTYLPHIIAQVTGYTYGNETVNLLTNVSDLHRWYQDNVREVENEVPNAELLHIADSLTRPLTTELDKVKAVYYWVQENIKYIAFEEGVNGFVPRQPTNVLHKRYGDCKDMASIIYSMLKSVNIESNLTWVGTRHIPYKYEEFPTTAVDNHMIATYSRDGKVYVLDATSSFQPIGLPSSFIQGKELLIHQGPDKFTIHTLPVEAPEASRIIDTTRITISGTKLSGSSESTLSGYHHIDVFHALNDVAADEQKKRIAKLFRKGNNSCIIQQHSLKNLDNRGADARVSYDFTVQNYVTATANDLFLNLVLDKEIAETVDTKRRTLPIVFDNCSAETYTTILDIPEGYSAGALPKNTDFRSDFVDYSVTYSITGKQMICETKLTIKQVSIPVSAFDSWNQFQAERDKSLTQRIVLSKKQ